MKNNYKRLLACCVAAVGLVFLLGGCALSGPGAIAQNQSSQTPASPSVSVAPVSQPSASQAPASPSASEAPASQPLASGKAIVNIDGIIDEVAADGRSFRVGSLWVTVDESTLYGIPGPNAAPANEQLVSNVFQAGNAVSGYTQDDPVSGKVYAARIYNNFPPQA